MKPTPGGSSSSSSGDGGGGGGGLSRGGGLARFRSAPATWLEALLEEDDEGEGVEDSLEALKPTETLTQLLSSSNPINSPPLRSFDVAGADPGMFESSSSAAFLRQNSSPADLFGGEYDGFFGNYGHHDFMSTPPPPAADKRPREPSSHPRFLAKLKGEQSGGDGVSSYLDLDREMDRLLEDSVPCRVRAKRGMATHPRSIAERVITSFH